MNLDLTSYQSKETAWRYDSFVERTKKDIQKAKIELKEAEDYLFYLQINPPKYHLFNWSA